MAFNVNAYHDLYMRNFDCHTVKKESVSKILMESLIDHPRVDFFDKRLRSANLPEDVKKIAHNVYKEIDFRKWVGEGGHEESAGTSILATRYHLYLDGFIKSQEDLIKDIETANVNKEAKDKAQRFLSYSTNTTGAFWDPNGPKMEAVTALMQAASDAQGKSQEGTATPKGWGAAAYELAFSLAAPAYNLFQSYGVKQEPKQEAIQEPKQEPKQVLPSQKEPSKQEDEGSWGSDEYLEIDNT